MLIPQKTTFVAKQPVTQLPVNKIYQKKQHSTRLIKILTSFNFFAEKSPSVRWGMKGDFFLDFCFSPMLLSSYEI